MKSLYYTLHSEFYKSRRTLAFWSTLLLPLLICGLVFMIFFLKSRDLISYVNASKDHSLWNYFMEMILTPMGILILPMYIIFMAYSVNSIEHRGEMWKSLFSLPNPRWSIYFGKALFALMLVFLCLFLFAMLTWVGGTWLGRLKPELGFQNRAVGHFLSAIYFKLFLASVGILSIQFFMSLVWPDFLKPMGFGFLMLIISLIALRWQYSYFIPYAQPALLVKTICDLQDGPVHLLSKENTANLLLALLAFPLGYFIISARNIK